MKKLLLILFLVVGCSSKKTVSINKEVKVIFASDIHYLSDKLYGNEAYFKEMMENADGKLTDYSASIMEELTQTVIDSDCDYFVISGDLTFNGEKQSLIDLGKYFQRIEKNGISVLIIPGNHDINYPYAYDYSNEGEIVTTEKISGDSFKAIMQNFGYGEALYKDENSFSYVYELSNNLWFLFIDANTEGNYNRVPNETLIWIDNVLQKAEGRKVISITHQNMLNHSTLSSSFTIDNYKEIREILLKYGVVNNFSGHIHMQHTKKINGFTDVAIGSVSVNPLRYLEVYFDTNREPLIEMKALNTLKEEALERFNIVTDKKIRDNLTDVPDDALEIMVEFGVRVNRMYFSGDILDSESLLKEEGWQLFKAYGKDTRWFNYLHDILYE